MVQTIQSWLSVLDPFWPYIGAIVLPLVASWGITQAVKYVWRAVKHALTLKPARLVEKGLLRGLAVIVCFVGAKALWPAIGALWFALALAPWSPILYGITVNALYHRWPMLEDWVSAEPRQPRQP